MWKRKKKEKKTVLLSNSTYVLSNKIFTNIIKTGHKISIMTQIRL